MRPGSFDRMPNPRCRAWSVFLLLFAMLFNHGDLVAQQEEPTWIWSDREVGLDVEIELSRSIKVESPIASAYLLASFDHCRGEVSLNGQFVAQANAYGPILSQEITELVQLGENKLRVVCASNEGPPACAFRVVIRYEDDSREVIVSDRSWQWRTIRHDGQVGDGNGDVNEDDANELKRAVELGVARRLDAVRSFDDRDIGRVEDYAQWKRAIDAEEGTDPATFDVPDGFSVRRLRSATDEEGSWVCMTQDPTGRWIIAREKHGLIRIELDESNQNVTNVEVINETLAECRGLVFVGESLFAMANNDKGLYRLRDTTDDDQFDEVVQVASFPGDVGHGRNQICVGPDGRLYVICGDAVFFPETQGTLVPPLSSATEVESTRHGYVARSDEMGEQWEIVVQGLRNPYGLAFNGVGDMFTYDADAEYDMGASWYRPTRVLHLLPGGDYGWRRVTQRWPPYFPDRPDMPEPNLEIGKGSPTSVVFGRGQRFPSRYRNALYVLDWAYGRIVAVHLQPSGSSYAGAPETFLRGRPLNVTDVEFGDDGAMYFVTGGRGTQAALYRVDYEDGVPTKEVVTEQQVRRDAHAQHNREILKELQYLYAKPNPKALPFIWSNLKHSDPWIRHGARTALEWLPTELWGEKALDESDPQIAMAALMALARCGTNEELRDELERLVNFDLSSMSIRQIDEALFVIDRAMDGADALDPTMVSALLEAVDQIYPHRFQPLNRTLSEFLSRHVQSDSFVPRTMNLLTDAETQLDRFHYLYVLRDQTEGWTPELRQNYFDALRQSDQFISGQGMPTFLRLIREASLATLESDELRSEYSKSIEASLLEEWRAKYGAVDRPWVREWSAGDLAEIVAGTGDSREVTSRADIENGAKMFEVAQCILCHRMNGRGGVSGPDLTDVSGRFSASDLLDSILTPSEIVAEKYRTDTFVLANGQVITGRILAGDFRAETLTVLPDLLHPEDAIEFAKADIEEHTQSPVSAMPSGLVDRLKRDEIRDLLAYLLREGAK